MDVGPKDMIPLVFKNSISFTDIYFEAIANSFDAGASQIDINIEIESFKKAKGLKLTISDNGSGFTDKNFKRFKKLLSPKDKYHKGVGRLVFLNYFNNVSIKSVYGSKIRSFVFSNAFVGDCITEENIEKLPSGTTLTFTGFSNQRLSDHNDLRPEAIKKELLEHFFPTLYSKKKDNESFEMK